MSKVFKLAAKIFSGSLFCLGILQGNSQTPYLPANYPSNMPVNYVRTWDALKPESNANNVTTAAAAKDFRMTTQYIDGLGRPIQTVVKQGSSAMGNPATDMVNAIIYDEFGRESYKFLPFSTTGGTPAQSDGSLKSNPFVQQAGAYNSSNSLSPIAGQGETYFYGQTKYEASPLNRVIETFAPGNSWVGTAGQALETDRRSVKIKYYTNTVNDAVRIWTVDGPTTIGNWGTYTTTAAYPAGELYKTITVDEHNKQMIEFKDKGGKLILKKVQIGSAGDNGIGVGHTTDWLCTYYIYDDLGNLRCVIMPQCVKAINGTWTLSPGGLNEHCFRYEYDERNRMIMKRVPGTAAQGETWMVYDARDRLVMMQDGNMRLTNRWMITKYDALNRPIETGLWISFTAVGTHRANATTANPIPISYPSTPTNYEQLTVTHYDDYTGLPGGLTNTFNNAGSSEFYTNYNTAPVYAQPLTVSTQTLGMVAWTGAKVLGTTSDFIYSVNLYDEKGRLTQTKTKNNTGGEDISTTQYNWAGQPVITVNKTDKAGANARAITVINKLTYDDLARLIQLDKKLADSKINSGALSATWVPVFTQSYDANGQLKTKALGNKKASNGTYYSPRQPLQELQYDYNIRGWMLGMNRDYLTEEGQTTGNKLFGFELGYDKLISKAGNNFTAAQYNGNINGLTWKSDGDDRRRRYDFSYDAANRLLKADFKQNNIDGSWNNSLVNFNVQMGNSGADDGSAYDANGNILKMKQWGLKLTGPAPVDNLTYAYWNSGNMLKAVTENSTTAADNKLGDFTDKNTTTTDYGYDRNGNLVIDLNKRINGTVAPNTGLTSGTGIVYNHLNLPTLITVRNDANTADKGTITYTYDANGVKLKKVTFESGANVILGGVLYTTDVTSTTTYVNGAVFESREFSNTSLNPTWGRTDVLQFLAQEEGRIRAAYTQAGLKLEYDYMLKDHLGNVRMVLTEERRIDGYPAASMETAFTVLENIFYSNLDATRVNRPSGYVDNYTNPNDKVALVRGDGNKIGPAILLKVMAGDKFNVKASAWWEGTGNGTNTSPLTSIVSALISGAPGISDGKIGVTDLTSAILDPQVGAFLANDQPAVSGKPKAYLNWIFFDEQFRYVGNGNSGAESVEASGAVKQFNKTNLPANQNGYLYIYTSNETNYDVFFDNLQVTYIYGPLMEEAHYYPFGLTMGGISSKALDGEPENKYRWNKGSELQNNEFSDGSGLDWYATPLRSLDPQIGRWWQTDPKPDYAQSLYSSMNNNPISFNDPLGDTIIVQDAKMQQQILKDLGKVYGKKSEYFQFNNNGVLGFTEKGTKALVGSVVANFLTGGTNQKTDALANSLVGVAKAMSSSETTGIVYSNDKINATATHAATGQIVNGVRPTDTGGEFTLTKTDNPNGIIIGGKQFDNVIFVNPKSSTTKTIFATQLYNPSQQLLLQAATQGGIQVTNQRPNLLMHGLGHVIYQSPTGQPAVIKYDNYNRILSGNALNQDLDGSHR